jgi:Domain of unknown function (DUF2437)
MLRITPRHPETGMKFISFLREGRASYGLLDGDAVIDLAPFAATAALRSRRRSNAAR